MTSFVADHVWEILENLFVLLATGAATVISGRVADRRRQRRESGR